MDEKFDVEELEKHVSDISVISENENTYNSIIKWSIPKSDLEKNIRNGNEIKSNWFSIGSPSYCTFNLKLCEHGNICSVCIAFKNKFPEGAWIEGKISIDGLVGFSQTFSVCGKDADKQINLNIFTKSHQFIKYFNATNYDVTIQCTIKIKLKEIKCTLDKHTVQHIESRNYDLHKNSLSENDFLSDVTFCVESCEIKLHRVLLEKIPFFRQLFDKDISQRYFELTGISLSVLKIVLSYLYTEAIPELNFRLACELYVVACDLKVFDLKNICSTYLGAHLTRENVFIVISLSAEGDDISLKKECIKFIKTSDFEQLTRESVVL